jgi:hypothetical protein
MVVGTLFTKTSTRTRTSFGAGAPRLGANVIAYGRDDLQTNTGKSIADTGRVLGRMLDLIVVRTAGDPAPLRKWRARTHVCHQRDDRRRASDSGAGRPDDAAPAVQPARRSPRAVPRGGQEHRGGARRHVGPHSRYRTASPHASRIRAADGCAREDRDDAGACADRPPSHPKVNAEPIETKRAVRDHFVAQPVERQCTGRSRQEVRDVQRALARTLDCSVELDVVETIRVHLCELRRGLATSRSSLAIARRRNFSSSQCARRKRRSGVRRSGGSDAQAWRRARKKTWMLRIESPPSSKKLS